MRNNKLTQTLTKGLRLVFIVALGTGLALGAAPVPVAQAATFVVDRTDDNAAATACTAASNDCSLRGAITAANIAAGADTITLPAGTYPLTRIGSDDTNADGDLDILPAGGDLTINGAGAGSTIIDGVYNDRVFHIDPGGVGGLTVTISGVTIRHGYSALGPGGGIYNNGGTVNIADNTLSGNWTSSAAGLGGFGGGIYNDNSGIVNITNSTLSGNVALNSASLGGSGGGIFNVNNGTVSIANSTLSGNTALNSAGGGLGGVGGGIYNDGTVTIANSTLSGNKASASFGGSGGGINNSGPLTITNSTLSGNTASGSGGGINNLGTGSLTITNSTLSGNTASDSGGGISNPSGTANLNNVTITNNTADADAGGLAGDGGGIYHAGGTVNLKNTILARNSDNSTAGNVYPDCSGTLTTSGDNMVQDTSGCSLVGTGTNVTGVDPLLGGLANNGGSTQTHALQAGSQAIDAVTDCTDLSSNPVTTDQRGVTRPQGAACDVGAYEAEPNLSSIDKTVTPATDVTYHGAVTYTVVLSNSGAGHATGTVLTDTLPGEVDFASWVEQPAGANVASDQLTWSGTVSGSTALTFAFVVNHVGDYGDVVTNTAEYGHATSSGSDYATFTVIGPPVLSINKTVTPTTDVTYHGVVTYTVVLNNNGVTDARGLLLTDTLPTEVDFANWVEQPANANQANDQITWSGTVSVSTAITFAFAVTHTGDYGDAVSNTAEYSHTIRGSDCVTFTVVASPTTYLPLIQKSNVITP